MTNCLDSFRPKEFEKCCFVFPTIRVRIPLKPTVFFCKNLCLKRTKNNKKRPGMSHLQNAIHELSNSVPKFTSQQHQASFVRLKALGRYEMSFKLTDVVLERWPLIGLKMSLTCNATRLGDLLDFGQLFKA